MGHLFHSLLKVLLIVFAASMVLVFLLVGTSAALLMLVWSLLTGRKPAVWTTFTRFRDMSRQFQGGSWPGQGGPRQARADAGDDIVDVQAHEVRGVLSDRRDPL